MRERTTALAAEGPVVEIVPAVFARLQAYVQESPGEISGFGLICVEDGNLVVDDIFIAPQHCSAASTAIADGDLDRFLSDLLERGGDPGRLHLYWHSHADMDVFWSDTDVHTLESAFPQAEWVLGLVTNRRGELKTCLYVYAPVPLRLYDLPVRLHLGAELREQIRAEIAGNVRQGLALPRIGHARNRRWAMRQRPDAAGERFEERTPAPGTTQWSESTNRSHAEEWDGQA
jgi:hypothetical protein